MSRDTRELCPELRQWQVLGSNQRRLSRRFYSTLAPPESPPADQHIRASRRDSGAATVRYASVDAGFRTLEIHGRGTDGDGGSGCTDRGVLKSGR